MKKILKLLVILTLCISFTACAKETPTSGDDTSGGTNENTLTVGPTKDAEEKVTPTEAAPTEPAEKSQTMTVSEFDALLQELPITVTKTEYAVQDENYKSLYPDMLQAILKNNTTVDIKTAIVAFVAWDSNNLPVKIKGSIDFSGGSYIKEVNFSDINIIPGGTYGDSSGYEVDESCGINTFKAVVVSYETFEGSKWENPYYDEFTKLYEGKKLDDTMNVEVKIEEIETVQENNSEPETSNVSTTTSELDEIIKKQELAITKTEYVVQDEKYKSLYPDMLQVIVQNNTDADVKNAVIAFIAWDSNNLPVKIKGNIDFSDGSYIKEVSYDEINLIPGGTYGDSSGYEVNENCGIANFKAIVVSYETFEGQKWENPYYDDFKALYEGKKLSK